MLVPVQQFPSWLTQETPPPLLWACISFAVWSVFRFPEWDHGGQGSLPVGDRMRLPESHSPAHRTCGPTSEL